MTEAEVLVAKDYVFEFGFPPVDLPSACLVLDRNYNIEDGNNRTASWKGNQLTGRGT